MSVADKLLAAIDRHMTATARETGVSALSPEVRTALLQVPRAEFVPAALTARAYDDCALEIGHGQTISQPFIVALMTELAQVRAEDRVLEVGTGCGYQTAVLAQLAAHVYSIEIQPALAADAAARLRRLGVDNLDLRVGDGHAGWAAAAPFDAILVTAACPRLPQPLLHQLALGGRLVAPVARADGSGDDLLSVRKDVQGRLHQRRVLGVRFVPLTGGNA